MDTRSLSKNFDQLSAVLSALGTSFDVIGITEMKQQIGKEFISNVNINNYLMYTQPSKSSADGVAIYINNKFDHVKWDDLSILHDDFELVWVEIKNKKGTNFLCGCMYRHPNTDVENFLGHINQHFQDLTRISIMSSSWATSILICYSMNLTVIPMTL